MGKETGMMNDRTKIEILREEIVIPQIVQEKADKAYNIIRNEEKGLHNTRKNKTRKILPFVAVAVMMLAGAVTAAGTKWNTGISEKWRVEEQQKESLQEEGAVSFAMQSQTQNGITITAEQSVTDNYSVYLGFRVEGYSSEEGLTPTFEEIQINVDGVDGANYSTGFNDGLANGEDSGMTYWVSMTESERGWALGRDIHVEFKNLCGYDNQSGEVDVNSIITGVWKFDWNLRGTDQMREWVLEEPLGDSGAVIRRIELSPASGYVECDWPRQRETRQAVGQDGEITEISRPVKAPRMSGVRLKDGTEYRSLFSGDGSEGYVSSEPESIRYYACRGCERLIDPKQVAVVFFENSNDGGFYEIVLEGD